MGNVLITGTSSGFGLVSSVELARRGWQTFATMRNLDKRQPLEAAAARAGAAQNLIVEQLDVTQASSIDRAVNTILARSDGRLDALVHNAGIAVAGAFEDLPDADVRRVMETNFFGVLNLTRALLPTFRRQRHGRIVIVSSNSAFFGEPANSVYCASKFAVEGWAESLAFEVEPFGVAVVLVEPGPYRTEIWDSSPRVKPPESAYRPFMEQIERAMEKYIATHLRDPQEVADVILQALESPHPRFRYPVSSEARVGHFLRGKIPSRLMRRTVQRYLGVAGMRL